ncbi:hypothetical protein PBCV1_a541R [Paramecium bursaria Chlorella virus 1]|uniref:Uncharacterized protein n=1 Tax=Paramecium bursaria Chlorella virus 1 TaxID=10506 RepID=O41023_PBCV1|nr:hypothetical protein PBCV1_a541R [Paramecium bursaria Chlorella virus 1]AAC96992.1 hypothetical protein [Paramecium bursaria Chlorella virus 1]
MVLSNDVIAVVLPLRLPTTVFLSPRPPELNPTMVLRFPAINLVPANVPITVLLDPVVILFPAYDPMIVLFPEVIKAPQLYPTSVLLTEVDVVDIPL